MQKLEQKVLGDSSGRCCRKGCNDKLKRQKEAEAVEKPSQKGTAF